MEDGEVPLVAALVVLRPASGVVPGGFDTITAANVIDFLPLPTDVERSQLAFREAGFNVGPIGGAAFSIEGSIIRFEKAFGVTLRVNENGVWVVDSNGELRRELPLDAVPEPVASSLVTITFESPATLDDRADDGSNMLDQ